MYLGPFYSLRAPGWVVLGLIFIHNHAPQPRGLAEAAQARGEAPEETLVLHSRRRSNNPENMDGTKGMHTFFVFRGGSSHSSSGTIMCAEEEGRHAVYTVCTHPRPPRR